MSKNKKKTVSTNLKALARDTTRYTKTKIRPGVYACVGSAHGAVYIPEQDALIDHQDCCFVVRNGDNVLKVVKSLIGEIQ